MFDDRSLTTQRLRLLPVTNEHAPAIWSIHSDPCTNENNPSGPMEEYSEAEDLAREWADEWANEGQGYWAVEEILAPGAVIGFGGIRPVPWQGRRAFNLYYRFSPASWGQGFATELVHAAVKQWRKADSHLPLIARTTADNMASQRTAIRGGLVRRPEFDDVQGSHANILFALGLE